MASRLTGLETKTLLLVALVTLMFAGGWYGNDGKARIEQQGVARVLHLGELLSASASVPQAPSGARRIETVGTAEAALIRMRDAVKALLTDYQFDGASHLRLTVVDEAILTRMGELRRGAEPQGAFDVAAVMRLAAELIGREQQRLELSVGKPSVHTAQSWDWFQPLMLVLTALTAILLLRDARSWRRRALKPDAVKFLEPGQTIADRKALMSGIQVSIASSLNRSKTIGLMYLQVVAPFRLRETLGPQGADQLIGEFANRLRTEFRRSDLVARLDGDVVVVMASDIASRNDLKSLETRIHRVLEALNVAAPHGVLLGVDVGAAMYPIDGYSAEDMLAAARAAMQSVKTMDGQVVVPFKLQASTI